MRSALWELWSILRNLPHRGDIPFAEYADDPPDRGADTEIRKLRLEHLLMFRNEAKVLTDRLGLTRGQLWGSGVRVGVSDADGVDVLMEFAGGTVLAARRVDPARNPTRFRLRIEPTELPLLLT